MRKRFRNAFASCLAVSTLLAGMVFAGEEKNKEGDLIEETSASWNEDVSVNSSTFNTGEFDGIEFRNTDTYADGTYNLGQFRLDSPIEEGEVIHLERFHLGSPDGESEALIEGHVRDIVPTGNHMNADVLSWKLYGRHGKLSDNPFGITPDDICTNDEDETYPLWADYYGVPEGYNYDTRLAAYGDTLDEVNLVEETSTNRNMSMGWHAGSTRSYCMVFYANQDINENMQIRQTLEYTGSPRNDRTGIETSWDDDIRGQFRFFVD